MKDSNRVLNGVPDNVSFPAHVPEQPRGPSPDAHATPLIPRRFREGDKPVGRRSKLQLNFPAGPTFFILFHSVGNPQVWASAWMVDLRSLWGLNMA